MLNLVEKFIPETVEADASDAGLTTVEYAVAAAVVTAGALGLFVTLGDAVGDKIQALIDSLA